jgi:hypothetical protein
MAKNIYSHPDLSKTSGKFEGFTIDFMGTKTPNSTYWSLCNWDMDLTDFKKTHSDVTGGGAYGGLQTVINGKTAIISFWEVLYKENGQTKSHRATRLYPKGSESSFDGEGEGTNYIHDFDWPSNVWNRFVLHSWTDEEGYTYVGEWIQNLETSKWELFAYFNTKLKNSYITGGLTQFQENFNDEYFGYERSFQIKNMYAYDRTYKKWISLNKSYLSFDPASWGYNTAGTHEIGYTNSYFYGSTGLPVDDQKKYDQQHPPITGTISQPESPDFVKPKIIALLAGLSGSTLNIAWSIDMKTCPCYQYQVDVSYYSNSKYKNLYSKKIYRPEETKTSFNSASKGKYQIKVTCYAISSEVVSSTIERKL